MIILPTLSQVLNWIVIYKYVVIFPLAIIEGPIITVLVGFLVSIGQLNLAIAYIVLILGDLGGDAILYYMGKYGRGKTSSWWMKFLGVTQEKLEFVEKKIKDHPKKIFFIGKISHGIGALALVAAGVINYPFKQFIWDNFIPTLVKTFILLVIGYYFGQAYTHIQNYLDYTALIIAVVFIIGYAAIIIYSNSYFKNESSNSH